MDRFQGGTTVEGVGGHSPQGKGQSDLGQLFTAIESPCTDPLNYLTEHHLMKTCAIFKGIGFQLFDICTQGQLRQCSAVGKGIATDNFHTVRHFNTLQIDMVIETPSPDPGDPLFDDHLVHRQPVVRPRLVAGAVIVHGTNAADGQDTLAVDAPGYRLAAVAGGGLPFSHLNLRTVDTVFCVLVRDCSQLFICNDSGNGQPIAIPRIPGTAVLI